MANAQKNCVNYPSMQIIQAYFTLSNITLQRVVSRTIMRIIREVRISEGQIIRATLYSICASQPCFLSLYHHHKCELSDGGFTGVRTGT